MRPASTHTDAHAASARVASTRAVSSEASPRLRRFWVDPRFIIGIVLVAASVVGVSALVGAQNRTVQVYVARSTLVVGDTIQEDDLEVAGVRVPNAAAHYLTPGTLPESGVVVRSIARGELVPVGAVRQSADVGLTSVVIKASGPLSASVDAGSVVDVWAAHAAADKDYSPPEVLASNAVVVSVIESDALVTDRGAVSIELRVPVARVAAVLQAIADGQTLSVVPGEPAWGTSGDEG